MPFDLQAPEFDARQLALLVAGAVDRRASGRRLPAWPSRRHRLPSRARRGSRRAGPRRAAGAGRRGARRAAAWTPSCAASVRQRRRLARLEFLVDGDGQFLIVQERRQVGLEERIAAELHIEGRIGALGSAERVGLGHGHPCARLEERRASGLGEPDGLLQREARRHADHARPAPAATWRRQATAARRTTTRRQPDLSWRSLVDGPGGVELSGSRT
ncbi:MAG: hypothetical protein MZV63_23905 [Marinilabiliales bacterium]|nr:hypothetical protein [Marinilabiliales bacterium]